MGISLILLAIGLLLTISGLVLIVTRRQRKIAVVCLAVGILLIVAPPIFISLNTM